MKHNKNYYRCGLRKWSAFPLSSRISFIVSVLTLVLNLLVRYTTV